MQLCATLCSIFWEWKNDGSSQVRFRYVTLTTISSISKPVFLSVNEMTIGYKSKNCCIMQHKSVQSSQLNIGNIGGH